MKVPWLVSMVFACLLAATANAKANTAKDKDGLIDFVVGNFEFVLLHEIAHALITDKNIPILGPLEETADYLAIAMAIEGDGSNSAAEFLQQALLSTAYAFSTSWRLTNEQKVAIPYWDNHALSIQRYFAVMCLLYGSDTNAYASILKEIPAQRARSCEAEYRIAKQGFQWLVSNYAPQGENLAKVSYRFENTMTSTQKQTVLRLQELKLVENTVGNINALFGFELPLHITLRTCAKQQASWNPKTRELLVCYELFDAFGQIYQYQQASNTHD